MRSERRPFIIIAANAPLEDGYDQMDISLEIKASIKDYVAQNLLFSEDGYPYPDETSFLTEGIMDSMGVMELVAFAEEKFNITVEDDDITPENFDSVLQLANYVLDKGKK